MKINLLPVSCGLRFLFLFLVLSAEVVAGPFCDRWILRSQGSALPAEIEAQYLKKIKHFEQRIDYFRRIGNRPVSATEARIRNDNNFLSNVLRLSDNGPVLAEWGDFVYHFETNFLIIKNLTRRLAYLDGEMQKLRESAAGFDLVSLKSELESWGVLSPKLKAMTNAEQSQGALLDALVALRDQNALALERGEQLFAEQVDRYVALRAHIKGLAEKDIVPSSEGTADALTTPSSETLSDGNAVIYRESAQRVDAVLGLRNGHLESLRYQLAEQLKEWEEAQALGREYTVRPELSEIQRYMPEHLNVRYHHAKYEYHVQLASFATSYLMKGRVLSQIISKGTRLIPTTRATGNISALLNRLTLDIYDIDMLDRYGPYVNMLLAPENLEKPVSVVFDTMLQFNAVRPEGKFIETLYRYPGAAEKMDKLEAYAKTRDAARGTETGTYYDDMLKARKRAKVLGPLDTWNRPTLKTVLPKFALELVLTYLVYEFGILPGYEKLFDDVIESSSDLMAAITEYYQLKSDGKAIPEKLKTQIENGLADYQKQRANVSNFVRDEVIPESLINDVKKDLERK